MGSANSGKRDGKRTTSDMQTLDVRTMQRAGQLQADHWFSWSWSERGEVVATLTGKVETDRVILHHRRKAEGAWASMDYPVPLVWTPCHYGGQRAWWLCGCGRRVAVLYVGNRFACRHCHQLAYPSQREAPDARATRQANKLRARLGWKLGIFNQPNGRPKGMHQTTYWRLMNRYDVHATQVLDGIRERFGRSRA